MQYQSYKESLASLCRQSAILAVMTEKMERNQIDIESLEETCRMLKRAKEAFLREKEKAGFTDSLEFMEDNAFAGFRIQKGCIYGDMSMLMKICVPWYMEFPKANNYQFEVANLLIAHYVQKGAEDEPQISVKGSRLISSKIKAICRDLLLKLRGKSKL